MLGSHQTKSQHLEGTDLRDQLCLLYAAAAAAKSLQSCLTLCDPIDDSPPDSPVPGIRQARTLLYKTVAIPPNSLSPLPY